MIRLTGWLSMGWLVCWSVTPVHADAIYLNEAQFLLDAGPLTMESFEALALTSDVNTVDAGAFAISTAASSLRVRNAIVLGSHPTAGSQYVRFDGIASRSIVFSFDAGIDQFGVTLTDALESGVNPRIGVTTNGGANFPSALSGVGAEGSERFLGLIADGPFTQLTLTWNLADGVGLDEVLYGASAPTAVPEPASLFLLGGGALAAIGRRRLRTRRRSLGQG